MAPSPKRNHTLDLSGFSVLIVEDNDDSREMLRQMVAASGASVSTARYGREAIEHLGSHVPDIVLCDLVMPGVTGFRLLEWVRAQPGALPQVPFIAITALGMPVDFARTRAAGFAAHLVKPVDYGMIAAQLRKTLVGPRGARPTAEASDRDRV